MPTNPTATEEDEWNAETNIWALEGRRNEDGTLRSVSCRSRWCEVRECESGELQIRRKLVAECEYLVEDGVARLVELGDRDSEIEADAIEPMLLRTVPAAERAVGRVPGVEHVERVEETLGAYIEDGRTATVHEDR